MSTKRSSITATTGWNMYVSLFRLSDGKIFDWDDNTWKLISAPATTPGVAMTSLVSYGGSQSEFAADLNLSLVNAGTTPVNVAIVAFRRIGGSQAPATDTPIGEGDPITIVNGDVVVTDGPLGTGFQVVSVTDTTTTSGNNSHIKVQLLDAAGQLIDLSVADPTAVCTVNVQRDGVHNQFEIDGTDMGAPNANGWFEADYENPDWTADCGYTVITTITTGGITYRGLENLNIWP
jgi:hypothetical protein